jgi:hypothetical protein
MTFLDPGNTARVFEEQKIAYICRGGPNDPELPNLWTPGMGLVASEIQGQYLAIPRFFFISTGLLVGTLPAGAYINSVQVAVLTAFNAGGNNTLLCGTVNAGTPQASLPGTFNNLIASDDINATLTGTTVSGRGLGPQLCMTNDQDVYIQYTQTGAPATRGSAAILITYSGRLG